MSQFEGRVLVIGYGNPGRLDDGLGQALAERIEALGLPGVATEVCYQLAAEHALSVAGFDTVVFADADTEGDGPYTCRRLEPLALSCFTTHHLDPRAVLGLARDVYGAEPAGYLLGIRGYEFNEFDERLSRRAADNLDAAVQFIQSRRPPVVENGDHHERRETRRPVRR